MSDKVVLAYSGGLDTSVAIRWLKEEYNLDVITFTVDVGNVPNLAAIRQKAEEVGAVKALVRDAKEDFVNYFIFPALQADAIYEGQYPLATALARPLMAKLLVDVAMEEGASAVAHGCTGKGNDQVRFEITYMALDPEIKIIAPWREWDFKSRAELIKYASDRGIPVPVTTEKPYSSDRNLLHISFEGGILEDPWREPDESMFVMTVPPEKAPDKPEYVEIEFEAGNPVAVNGERLSPATLLAKLNEIGGEHGVGRVDMVENRFVGMKSRGVYETPGGTILRLAHQGVESITMDREVQHLRDSLVPRYSELVYNGFWFSPERKVLQELIDATQENVWGTARLKLYKGSCHLVGRKSEKSLYSMDFATFEEDEVYDQADATGFIKLNALRLKIAALINKQR